jgi:ubiquinone/menaquinone biosynthesis C-methylase UbiE
MIRRGSKQHPRLHLNHYEGPGIPEQSGSFDAVICCALLTSVIPHTQREAIVAEVFRLLRSDGLLHVAEFLRSPTTQYPDSGIIRSELGIETVHFYLKEVLLLLHQFRLETADVVNATSITGKPMRAVHYFGVKPSNHRLQPTPQAGAADPGS